uniref:Uncharacterized protein n=1 Tax=Clastoptera arizonana TaxID=38151 RepID=A0A1B6DLQ4_9HEMI
MNFIREKIDPNTLKLITKVLHVIGAVQFSFSVVYDFSYVVVPKDEFPLMSAFSGKFKFLTFWNAIVLSVYFIICCIIDLFVKTNKDDDPSLIVRIKDYMLPALAFPIAMFVGITFWGLYAIDRNLVLPVALDKYFPTWLNHIMHTNIMIFVILELILTYRKYPLRRDGLFGLMLYQIIYIVWMHIVYLQSGMWVYNVFNVLNLPQRIAFLMFSIGLGCVFYFVGEKLNYMVWGLSRQRNRQKQRKMK